MAPSLDLATDSAVATRALGHAIGGTLIPGDVVSLTGDLGAGKTTFVQGAAAALGVTGPVLSPTFTLVREYEGIWHLYHVDVYRLERIQDVMDLGLDEMLDARGIVFIEWGDAIRSLLPEEHLQVEFRLPQDADDDPPETDETAAPRFLTLSASGVLWAERWPHLAEMTAPWSARAEA